MDRVGTSGENDNTGIEVSDGVQRRGAGDAERENGEGPDTAGDKVGVLRAIV